MALTHVKSDVELWRGMQGESKVDFSILYQRHAKPLLNYGYKISSNHAMAQDAIQYLFVEIWNGRTNSTSVKNVKFYLFKALRYKIFRPLKTEPFPLNENMDAAVGSVEDNWTSRESEAEQLNHLQGFVRELPVRQREAINLKYYHNFGNEEIAKIMNINYQSVCNLLFKALNCLRKKVN